MPPFRTSRCTSFLSINTYSTLGSVAERLTVIFQRRSGTSNVYSAFGSVKTVACPNAAAAPIRQSAIDRKKDARKVLIFFVFGDLAAILAQKKGKFDPLDEPPRHLCCPGPDRKRGQKLRPSSIYRRLRNRP